MQNWIIQNKTFSFFIDNPNLSLIRIASRKLIFICSGFHRPLGVIPPSSSVSPHSRTPPSIYHLPRHYHAHYPAPTHGHTHLPGPASYGAHFPSHFYPEKLYQYWHHYYPRIPGTSMINYVLNNVLCWFWTTRSCASNNSLLTGAYKRLDNEMLSSYYDRDRSKSKSPKPMFYKSPSPQRSHWGGYF